MRAEGANRGPPAQGGGGESERGVAPLSAKGGSGGPPPEIFLKLHCRRWHLGPL